MFSIIINNPFGTETLRFVLHKWKHGDDNHIRVSTEEGAKVRLPAYGQVRLVLRCPEAFAVYSEVKDGVQLSVYKHDERGWSFTRAASLHKSSADLNSAWDEDVRQLILLMMSY